MYAKATNGQIDQYPYTVGDLRRDNPNTSFSRVLSAETLAEHGMVQVQPAPRPTHDAYTHRVVELTPVLVDGAWVQQWTTEANPDADSRIRGQRDALLQQSDWTQVSDAPVDKAAWAAYRQALRDIPQQDGFPLSVVWPAKPENP